MILKFRNGCSFLVRPYESDVTMLMETWGVGDYTPKGFEIKEKDVVFDIGTHIGSFSILAAKKAKSGKVFSFEPLPDNYKIFSKNINLNKLKNIKAYNLAVASKKGTQKLFLYEGAHTGSSSLYRRNTDNFLKIKTDTIQNIMNVNHIKRINFMKIDCEGAEYDILFNLPKNVLNNIEKISMEYHDTINEHKHQDLLEFFHKNKWTTRCTDNMIYAKNPLRK